jgi:hypothetical protein
MAKPPRYYILTLQAVNRWLGVKNKKPKKSNVLGLGLVGYSLGKSGGHGPRTGGTPSPGHYHAESPCGQAKLFLPVRHYFCLLLLLFQEWGHFIVFIAECQIEVNVEALSAISYNHKGNIS